MALFSEEEIDRRQQTFLRGLSKRSIGSAFIHTADSVCYLTGVPLLSEWGRPMWAVFDSKHRVTLVGAHMEQENMEMDSKVDDVQVFGDSENVWTAALNLVARVLMTNRALDPKQVGIEGRFISVPILQALESLLPNTVFVDIGDLLAEMRLIKSTEEIRIFTLAGQVAQAGARAFLDALTPGVTELAVASESVAEMNRVLADLKDDAPSSSYAYCHAGDHTLSPHLHPTGRRIRSGDVIALNVFPVVSGYCIELERTVVFGETTKDQAKALQVVTDTFQEVKDQLRPGVRMSDIDALSQKILGERGYGAFVRHGTGHALGILIGAAGREELGELRPYNHRALQAHMVCSIEPGIYVPGLGGFRHSDVMLLTDTKALCLTDFPA